MPHNHSANCFPPMMLGLISSQVPCLPRFSFHYTQSSHSKYNVIQLLFTSTVWGPVLTVLDYFLPLPQFTEWTSLLLQACSLKFWVLHTVDTQWGEGADCYTTSPKLANTEMPYSWGAELITMTYLCLSIMRMMHRMRIEALELLRRKEDHAFVSADLWVEVLLLVVVARSHVTCTPPQCTDQSPVSIAIYTQVSLPKKLAYNFSQLVPLSDVQCKATPVKIILINTAAELAFRPGEFHRSHHSAISCRYVNDSYP